MDSLCKLCCQVYMTDEGGERDYYFSQINIQQIKLVWPSGKTLVSSRTSVRLRFGALSLQW